MFTVVHKKKNKKLQNLLYLAVNEADDLLKHNKYNRFNLFVIPKTNKFIFK